MFVGLIFVDSSLSVELNWLDPRNFPLYSLLSMMPLYRWHILIILVQEGKTVLQIAEEKQHNDVVKLLMELMHIDDEMDITQKEEVAIKQLPIHTFISIVFTS